MVVEKYWNPPLLCVSWVLVIEWKCVWDVKVHGYVYTFMAGLGLFDQKSAIAVTMSIVTAFKFCIGHRKNGLLNR